MSSNIQSTIWRMKASSRTHLFFVLVLAVVFAVMRAVGMLGPRSLQYFLPASFLMMMLMPWILLNREGRRQMGLVFPTRVHGFISAIVLGALLAIACFAIGFVLFGTSVDNWYISIANNYRSIMDTSRFTMMQLHLIFTLPALLFSPIGEELFFRGLLQRALEERFSSVKSTAMECGIFGVVHLCHHGLFWGAAGLTVLPYSGAMWVCLMFMAGFLFAWLRKHYASLYPAMISHASFNLAMNICIFSALWTHT